VGDRFGDERRKYERKPTSIRVEMRHSAFGTIVGYAKDISDGGAQVLIERQAMPPVGTVVKVQFKKMVSTINQEPVSMRVMHTHKNTIGLMFTTNKEA
jgi:hypothetical protein